MPTEAPLAPEVSKAHLGSTCLLVMSAWFDEPSKARQRYGRTSGQVEGGRDATAGDRSVQGTSAASGSEIERNGERLTTCV